MKKCWLTTSARPRAYVDVRVWTFWAEYHVTDISDQWDYSRYMCRMVITAIWDVFWDQTDLLRALVRPPNNFSQKNRNPKKKFFGPFLPSQKGSTGRYDKTVRKIPTNEKIEIFFREFRSLRILVIIWRVSYEKCPILSYLFGPNFGFCILDDLTSLHTIEYSTHF